MEYGLIAEHLGHSFSKTIHEAIGDYRYDFCELAPQELEPFLKQRAFRGLNVTIPYKQAVIPLLDELSPAAQAIGAVNTIVNRNGRLWGDNTDFGGMRALIAHLGLDLSGRKVLILGTGGTSRTAFAVAQSLGAGQIIKVSRHPGPMDASYVQAAQDHSDAQIILNTTPSGMFPKLAEQPLSLEPFRKLEGVVDAVFNPLSTRLVLEARDRGILAQGGLYMLVAQAVLAAERFTGKSYPEDLTDRLYRMLLHGKQNLVLIGMPGSGKSTVGRLLAEKLGRPFLDLDEEIVHREGREITEIFQQDGEAYFRDLESRVTAELSARTGLVLATGGGCVLRKENVTALRQNGCLLLLNRPLAQLLPTQDRPLANSAEKIRSLFETRMPIYRAAADRAVHTKDSSEETAEAVLASWEETL